ncbi:hypothetical protein [Actinomadura sp. 9N215]|uniref:hypothetical protein n=1 Tax=Actinomadura sp. 9N215 TaxID=3375150 RepID=UPI0037A25959
MARSAWHELPARVRGAVQELVGDVSGFDPPPAGNHADIAGTLRTANGPVFVKGSRKEAEHDDGAEVRTLSWVDADSAAVELFSRAFAEIWRRRSAADLESPWKGELAALATNWEQYWGGVA